MRHRGLLLLSFVAFIGLGLPEGTLGVAWPSMRDDHDRPLAALGAVLVAQTLGYLGASAAHGGLVARYGPGPLFVRSAAASTVGFALFAVSPWWPLLLAAAVVLGVAWGLLDAGANAYTALHHGVRAMNLLHACFGIGATIGPVLVTGVLRADLSWRVAYAALAALQVALTAAFWSTRARWRRVTAEEDVASHALSTDDPERTADDTRRRRSRPDAILVGGVAVFLVYTGLEVSAGQWAFTLLTEDRGYARTTAGLWVGGYWGSLTVGRLALALVGVKVTAERLLDVSVTGAVAATALLWWAPWPAASGIALGVLGVSLAGVFPALVTLTPVRLGAARADAAVGYQLAAASVGAAGLPALAGVVAQRLGVEALSPYLLAAAVSLAALHAALAGAARARATAPAPPRP